MSSDEVFRLESGPLRLEIDPSLGGSITSFRYVAGGTRLPVLRDAKPGYASVLESSSFPLVPYSNRIRGGRFVFRGREVTVAPNVPTDPSPLHGQGWMSPWRVERASPAQAELVFRHPAGEWPWDYEARQHFTLDDGGLGIRLSCRNLSGEPMPCGLGQHPYFPCTGETRLDTEVEGVWTIDADVLPIERVPATGRYDLRDRPVCGQDLDHGFDGWGGVARIHTPGAPFRIELSSPDATCFQLYSPPSGGLFVAEPVTHTNAALNAPEEEWERLGLRVLEPGEEMSLDARIAVISAG
jgi:aldose 1-epimerase